MPDGRPPSVPGYELLELVGEGAAAEVWRATREGSSEPGETVAIKVLRAGLVDRGLLERFQREAELLCDRLDHPNIVRGLEWGEFDGLHYLVLEFIEGAPLTALPAEGPLPSHTGEEGEPLRALLFAFEQLADALQYLHDEEILHRDVKPENVRVDPEGRAVLLDLGVVREQDRFTITREGDLIGTLANMAPEQVAAGRAPTDHRVDIFGLGASLYSCLTGRYPFEGRSEKEIVGAIINGDHVPLRKRRSRVPIDLDTIVEGCIAHRPNDRYACVDHVARDLRLFREGKPIVRKRPGRAQRLFDAIRRNPVPVLLLCLAVVVGIGQVRERSARTAHWIEVTFVELEGRDLPLEISLHPDETHETPYFSVERTRTGEAVRLPPNRHVLVTARDGAVEHTIGYTLIAADSGTELFFRFEPRRASELGWVRVPGPRPLWVRPGPVTYREVAVAERDSRETRRPSSRAWDRLGDLVGHTLDPSEGTNGGRSPEGGPNDPCPHANLTIATLVSTALGGRLPSWGEFERIARALEARTIDLEPTDLAALRDAISHPVVLATIANEFSTDGRRTRVPGVPEDAETEWVEREPQWLGRSFHPKEGFRMRLAPWNYIDGACRTIVVRDAPPDASE